jgi:hypothetical protein
MVLRALHIVYLHDRSEDWLMRKMGPPEERT